MGNQYKTAQNNTKPHAGTDIQLNAAWFGIARVHPYELLLFNDSFSADSKLKLSSDLTQNIRMNHSK